MEHKQKLIALLFLMFIVSCGCYQPKGHFLHNDKVELNTKVDSSKNKPILIVLSSDGFRADYINKANTPNIDSIMRVGIGGALIPSFPSQTFPNHYTLATGLYPDHHGIISNTFYSRNLGEYKVSNKQACSNPEFYKGEPIWNTAQRQGLTSTVYYWVGSEVPINGHQPNTWHKYDKHVSFEQRADYIFDQINKGGKNQPSLAMLYIEQPDAIGHELGADNKLVIKKVEQVDKFIGYILHKIKTSKYRDRINFLLVSDHGMATIKHNINLHKYINPDDFQYISYGTISNLYIKDTSKIKDVLKSLSALNDCRVYRKKDIPKYLHYGNNENVGDIVIIPNVGSYITNGRPNIQKGSHGYDNTAYEMRAIFAGFGNQLPKGKHIEDIPNVNIYPLMCRILGIHPSANDGDEKVVNKILEK